MKRFGEGARWTDLTIRLVVKANSISARKHDFAAEVTDFFNENNRAFVIYLGYSCRPMYS